MFKECLGLVEAWELRSHSKSSEIRFLELHVLYRFWIIYGDLSEQGLFVPAERCVLQ